MYFSPEIADEVSREIGNILGNDKSKESQVELIWGTIAYIKALELAKKLENMLGATVYSGHFKGMKLTPEVLTGPFAPKLLGIYEQELHPVIEQIIATPYQTILNIGCSFGYYTTGFALRMPQVKVYSFDIDPKEQQRCQDMVTLNNVSDRVTISGLFEGENFAHYADKKTLVFMDIEGEETALLDPKRYPALQKMDIVVELHDLMNPSISKTIKDRFEATHNFLLIPNRTQLFDLESLIGSHYIDPFEHLILGWEVRGGPTPWGFITVK